MQKPDYNQAVCLANAAGIDAGVRHARSHGRISWNSDDLRVGADVCEYVLTELGFHPKNNPEDCSDE